MQVIFTKGTQRYGQLRCVRMDGSATQTQMPEQGIAPHDMIHYVVEKRLHIQGAFSRRSELAPISASPWNIMKPPALSLIKRRCGKPNP